MFYFFSIIFSRLCLSVPKPLQYSVACMAFGFFLDKFIIQVFVETLVNRLSLHSLIYWIVEKLYSCSYFWNVFLKYNFQKSIFFKIPKNLSIHFRDLFSKNSILLVNQITGWNLTLEWTEWWLKKWRESGISLAFQVTIQSNEWLAHLSDLLVKCYFWKIKLCPTRLEPGTWDTLKKYGYGNRSATATVLSMGNISLNNSDFNSKIITFDYFL